MNSERDFNLLPVDIVFHPSWWFKHGKISFDKDFFYHPAKRVESERRMEQVLHERFGEFGLGQDKDRDLPIIGAVHNAAGYLIQEMMGCEVRYSEDAPPLVVQKSLEDLPLDKEAPFKSPAFARLEKLIDSLKGKYNYLLGDINWGGVLNCALDLRGQSIFLDLFDKPKETQAGFQVIKDCIHRFTNYIRKETGVTSISVNRLVRHIPLPVHLHSECTHIMISVDHYEEFLLPIDMEWSQKHRPYGIHYCGQDPHRFAKSFAKLPHLDFLDVGWGGDLKVLRKHLPHTFLNIRLNPFELIEMTEDQIRETITRLVIDSGNPVLTGVCCINMDDQVEDSKVAAIFRTVWELREYFQGNTSLKI